MIVKLSSSPEVTEMVPEGVILPLAPAVAVMLILQGTSMTAVGGQTLPQPALLATTT